MGFTGVVRGQAGAGGWGPGAAKNFGNMQTVARVPFSGGTLPGRVTAHMRTLVALLLLLPAMALLAAAADQPVVEKAFPSGGRVRMTLEAGAYTIRAAQSDVIRVTWDPTSYEGKEQVHVAVDLNGDDAKVRVENTPHNNFRATIEVPYHSDLHIRLTAGDLNVQDISGSKDIESRAGDMNIDIVEPNDYGKVDASVVAGDLNASAFNVTKGGLFRSFDWHGPGKNRLHAHLLAGDLNLRRALKKTTSLR